MASEFDFILDPVIDGSTPEPGNTFEPNAGASVFSLDYYRGKIGEFQSVLYGIDRAARIAYQLQSDPTIDAATFFRVSQWIDDFESKRDALRTAAQALNAAVSAANFFGADLPSIVRPGTLAALPALPAYAIPAALLATIAGLTAWGLRGIDAIRAIVIERSRTADLTPEQRAELESQRIEIEGAAQQAQSSPFASLANVAKWVAIGAAAVALYGAFKSYRETR